MIVIMILGKAVSVMLLIAQPMAALLPVDTVGGIALANVIALLGVLLVCYFAGLCARIAAASRMVKNIESKVLMKLPGYSVIRAITSGLDPEDAGNMKPVLVTQGSIQRLGYETEKLADGRSVVFLPGTPNPWSGISQIMAADHVEYIGISVMNMVDFHERYGNGSQELLDNVLVKNSPGNGA